MVDAGAGPAVDLERGVGLEGTQGVQGGTVDDVGVPGLEGRPAAIGVAVGGHDHAVELRLAVVVVVVAHQHGLTVDVEALELERARPDGELGVRGGGVDDHRVVVHQAGWQGRVGGFSDDLQRVLIRRLDGLDPQRLLDAGVDLYRVLEAGLDFLGGHLGAVVELDPLAEGEGPVLGISAFPLLGQPGADLQGLGIDTHEGLDRSGAEDEGGLVLMGVGALGGEDGDEPQGFALRRRLVRGKTTGAEQQGDGGQSRGQPRGGSCEHCRVQPFVG